MKTGEIFEPEMKIAVKLLQIVGEIAWEGHDHFDEEALPLGARRGKKPEAVSKCYYHLS